MAKNYAMTAIRRSLKEAHSSVTPGQDAKRTQPGDSSEQGKSASKRLTSISDAHSQPHHPSIVVAAPCAGQQGTCIQLPEDVFLQALVYKNVGRHKARPLQLLIIAIACIQQPEDVFLQALVHKDVGRHKARPLQLLIIAIK